jgi:hypothetical protein
MISTQMRFPFDSGLRQKETSCKSPFCADLATRATMIEMIERGKNEFRFSIILEKSRRSS